jgi:hypothetical protein
MLGMKSSTVWILVAALAAAYYFFVYRKKHAVHPAAAAKAAAGPSKKSKWRRALGTVGGNLQKMGALSGIPGAQFATGATAGLF